MLKGLCLECLENNSKKFLVSNLHGLNLMWVHSGLFCLEECVQAEFDLKETWLLQVWLLMVLNRLVCGSFFFFHLMILERGRERNIDLLFLLVMHSLVVSCMYPDTGSNPQPSLIGMMLHLSCVARAGVQILWECNWGPGRVRMGKVTCLAYYRLVRGSILWIIFCLLARTGSR